MNNRMLQFARRAVLVVLVAGLVAAAFVSGRASRDPASGDETATKSVASSAEQGVHAHDHDQQAMDSSGGDGGGGETVYYCSMHPAQQSTDPEATCPICGMDLVPMPDDMDGQGDMPVLRLSERSEALLNIEVARAERRTVEAPMHFVGKLEPNEQKLRDVVVRADSYVETLHADYDMKQVKAGEPLAELYSPRLQAAARELLVVRDRDGSGLSGEGKALASARGKLRRLGMGEEAVQRILDTGDVPRTYEIRSPIDGHVMNMTGREGDWLAEGERLVQVMDSSTLWLQLEAYEHQLKQLHVGQQVAVTIDAFPGETFEGEVSFISPHVHPVKRTAKVRVEVPNETGELRVGMYAKATVTASHEGDDADKAPLVVPASAPLVTGKRAVVYVKAPDADRPAFEGRDVTLGPRVGDFYIVEDGLEAGELVVRRGAFKLDSELQIRGRPSMMSPEDEGSMGHGGHGEQDGHDMQAAEDGGEAHEGHRAPVMDADGESPDFEASEALIERGEAVLAHYLAMVASLAGNDLSSAQSAAQRALEQLKVEATDAAGQRWRELTSELETGLKAFVAAEDLDAARPHLRPMAEPMVDVVKHFVEAPGERVYRARCPMAVDGEAGDWLQPHEEIRNPYKGDGNSMFHCGEVVSELTASRGE